MKTLAIIAMTNHDVPQVDVKNVWQLVDWQKIGEPACIGHPPSVVISTTI